MHMRNKKTALTAIILAVLVFVCGCSCARRPETPVNDQTQGNIGVEPTKSVNEPSVEPGSDVKAPSDGDGESNPSQTAVSPTGTSESEPEGNSTGISDPEPSVLPTGTSDIQPTAEPTKAPTAVPTPSATPTPTPVPKGGNEASDLACPSKNGALQVIGTQLSDESGNPVQLRGISTHGIAWFPDYVNQDLFTEMRQNWNVNIVRLAMYTDEYAGYCSGGDKEKLKKLVKSGVEYATKADLYVIIDWHVLNDRDPNKYIDDAKAFFDEMSKLYASNNNVIYEICNEPNGSTSWQDIKKYAEKVIPVIRANDKDAVIIVGTPNWSQYVDKAAADPIKGEKNIMYALHFYAATHKDDLRRKLKSAYDNGLPIFVTEYGICDASGNGGIDRDSAQKWVDLMDSCGISYVCWNLSNKNETSALIKSSCRKTSGIKAEDMSEEGTWLLDVLSKVPGAVGSINDTKTDDTGKDNGKTDNGGTGTGTGNTGNDDKSTGDAQKYGDQGILPASGKTGDIVWECSVSNSWESEGKTFCQYDITVKNTSKSAVDSWTITIDASANPSISNIWCAKAEVSGKTITVTNESFNGMINAGESVSGIGIIVSD